MFHLAAACCFLVVTMLANRERLTQRFLLFLVGLPFRLVFAILRSSALLIDSYMPLDAPLSEDFLLSPLLAANAAPAAICCFFDFAGIQFFLLVLEALYFASKILLCFAKFLLKTSKQFVLLSLAEYQIVIG
jgi:hypothetical protein